MGHSAIFVGVAFFFRERGGLRYFFKFVTVQYIYSAIKSHGPRASQYLGLPWLGFDGLGLPGRPEHNTGNLDCGYHCHVRIPLSLLDL